jgi:hypothetical protein
MTSSMPMGNLLSFISPYLESMLLARRLKISLQQHLPDSEHQNHEMRDRMALIIVALDRRLRHSILGAATMPPTRLSLIGGLPSAAASAVAA